MTQALALPTRKDEDFRYADLAALAPLWPVAVETIAVAAGERGSLALVLDGSEPVAREIAITLGDGASFDLRVLNAPAAYGRVAVRVELGAGAEFTLGAAQLAGGDQTVEIVTDVLHAHPDAISRQVVRSVAGGSATANYLGKVRVAKGADGTDGEQSVRAMLLDRTATANARPELEIFADDVKCAHGCAVGELDANSLFYMAQRGLPPELAKRLMLQAFVAEAFTGAADEEALQAAAKAALERLL
ncbi:SufD family Fe-S cluster assembly protein [Novosphingobium sp.]|uniref:SufD family Fe-S cluster assembly protein n=1 Tax=Novosphingobium sp. TaxID=1874826 RepID=UPI0022C473CD|nr:SufD family Fe-S cluster assembly protein [Novosphingobium sp.]MCZ8018994.1 SufD family Fe-S cluster assembly protein [Novosphingobium sp.]MCZ8034600.1 SufD family Fe-S cluster assembly protein [Novosphingobium sp.]MCZ8052148.1 SufD family Fe-S cluster assembly protein [Novosphingobium sp.]MCZ8060074.1 SufD family Fe-S cluster assembly protein [Novosphingobium sp.]MCZ8231036.1 SufD family Fe-S cluster assembly protein [Novosphingobium sp.]